MRFNLAFGKVIRNAKIQTSGTTFYKSVQLLAYADDVDIIARSRTALKEAFLLQGDKKKRELLKNPTKIEEIEEKKFIDRN